MRVLILNSAGLRDTCKHYFIQESFREQKIDLVALLETWRSHFSDLFLHTWQEVEMSFGFVSLHMGDPVAF
jgi:3-methyladenine DNA glycosylase/8-oxoguanine DNA glycosylase